MANRMHLVGDRKNSETHFHYSAATTPTKDTHKFKISLEDSIVIPGLWATLQSTIPVVAVVSISAVQVGIGNELCLVEQTRNTSRAKENTV